jgi:hypothetical protein
MLCRICSSRLFTFVYNLDAFSKDLLGLNFLHSSKGTKNCQSEFSIGDSFNPNKANEGKHEHRSISF